MRFGGENGKDISCRSVISTLLARWFGRDVLVSKEGFDFHAVELR